MLKHIKFNVDPVPKPRMTQRDKWAQRPCVIRYRAMKDRLNHLASAQGFILPDSGIHIIFNIQIAKSQVNKIEAGTPHQQRPDVDNLLKGIFDTFHSRDDSHIYDVRCTKRWAESGSIEIFINLK